jgi:hypothetical protein
MAIVSPTPSLNTPAATPVLSVDNDLQPYTACDHNRLWSMSNGVDFFALRIWAPATDFIRQIAVADQPGVSNRPDRIISKIIDQH